MRVGVRVDAGPLIGGGHAMRCLTLADALAERGAEVTFATAAMPEALERRIADSGHKVMRIPASPELDREGEDWHERPLGDAALSADAESTGAASGSLDWLIVDHYLLDCRWHEAARRFARRILVIDDLANRNYDCDLLLDQTFGRSAADYRRRVPADATILAGATYALLRPEFTRERPAALEARRDMREVRRILVSLGTTDLGGITATIVEQVLAAAPGVAVDAVLAPDAASLPRIRELADEQGRLTLHVGTNRMAELMRDADVAIGAAGATSWERCCLGLPAIVVVLAENQRMIGDELARAGAHMLVDRDDEAGLGSKLDMLLSDPTLRSRMSAAAFAIVDGGGTERVVGAMLGASSAASYKVELRPATRDDAEMLWLWRNEPVTREQSRAVEPIGWTDHIRWFAKVVSDPSRRLMIAERTGVPIGMIRFDALPVGELWEVSIVVAPEQRGSGLGRAILEAGCAQMRRRNIQAHVRPGNEASRRLFEVCGFCRQDSAEPGFLRYVLPAHNEFASQRK